jgi:hypothetical protein
MKMFLRPALNPKCLVFSGALALGYWYLPPKNPVTVIGLLLGGYIALAWYDELYNCDERLQPGLLDPVTGWLKPPVIKK